MILSTYFVSHSFYKVAVVRAGKLSVYIKATGLQSFDRPKIFDENDEIFSDKSAGVLH